MPIPAAAPDPFARFARRRRQRAAVAFLGTAGACIAALVLHARGFLPFIADDSLISLRYSDRLMSGQGLTWTDGERVEGYSNLLWVVATAVTARLTSLGLIDAARLLGIASMAAAMLALLALDRRIETRRLPVRGLAAIVLAASPPVAVWAIGGLEQPLLAALLALGLVGAHALAFRPQPLAWHWVGTGLALGGLCLTRPDSLLLVAAIGLGILLARGLSWRSLALAAAPCLVALLFAAAQLAFRRIYYQDWLPNTAYAKVSLSGLRLREGLQYLASAALAMPLLALTAAGGLALLFTRGRRRALLLMPAFIAWSAYVAVIGGDIFPGFRHCIPLLVFGAFLLVAELDYLIARRTIRLGVGLLPVAAGVAALALFPGAKHPEIQRARDERWEWEARPVGALMQRAFGPQRPLLAADAAGCLPFFSRLPALDLLGLNDRYLARHPPPDFGRGMLAHELGDGKYVLSRSPDLVMFCGPLGSATPCYRSGRELVGLPGFKDGYRLVRLRTPPPGPLEALVWVHLKGKLGPEIAPDVIRIPAVLLGGKQPLTSHLADDGTLQTTVGNERASAPAVTLPPGTWTVTATSDQPVKLHAMLGKPVDKHGPALEAAGPLTFTLKEETPVTVEVTAVADKTAALAAIQLRRQPR